MEFLSARHGNQSGDGGRQADAQSMLGNMKNPHQIAPNEKSSMDRLNDAAMKITQNAAERNMRADMEAEALEQIEYEQAVAAAQVRHIEIEEARSPAPPGTTPPALTLAPSGAKRGRRRRGL